jgi:antitoxin (DNA-binding transcriptional repressor) of toxin-antitoxin stability system
MKAFIGWPLAALLLGSALAGVPIAAAQSAETTGLVTEIKLGQGVAEVKRAGAWRAVAPLLAVRAGDEIRVTEDTVVVVLLTGARGTVRLDARNTPWTAPAVSTGSVLEKAQALVASSIAFLTGAPSGPAEAVISTRAGAGPPRLLSPRGGPLLGTPLVIEWTGSQFTHYTVRVSSPAGVVLERKGVAGPRFAYPDDAPPLGSGVLYTVQVEHRGHASQPTTFEVLEPTLRATVVAELAELEASLAASPTSLAAVKAGVLANAGLLHDARQAVMGALAKDPDEPTLFRILGALYLRTGLDDQAVAAFGEANYLLRRRR